MVPLPELLIPKVIWQQMAEQAAEGSPNEVCGILAGKGKEVQVIYPVRNILNSQVRFRMDPQEQLKTLLDIEALGLEMQAIYHSHPAGPPNPSETDTQEFAYPGVLYLIWTREKSLSTWTCRGFQINKDETIEVPLSVISEL